MSSQDTNKRKLMMDVRRVEALSDGIFAIVMTLFVLSIDLPAPPQDNADEVLRESLVNVWPQMKSYLLSFFLLGVFWVIHHRQLHFIKRVDSGYLWINIIYLMLVALVPFSTGVLGDYSNIQDAALVFEFNLLCVGLFQLAAWYYATRDFRLVDPEEFDPERMRIGLKLNLIIPAISLVAMGLSFINPYRSTEIYILIPLIIWLLSRRGVSNNRLAGSA